MKKIIVVPTALLMFCSVTSAYSQPGAESQQSIQGSRSVITMFPEGIDSSSNTDGQFRAIFFNSYSLEGQRASALYLAALRSSSPSFTFQPTTPSSLLVQSMLSQQSANGDTSAEAMLKQEELNSNFENYGDTAFPLSERILISRNYDTHMQSGVGVPSQQSRIPIIDKNPSETSKPGNGSVDPKLSAYRKGAPSSQQSGKGSISPKATFVNNGKPRSVLERRGGNLATNRNVLTRSSAKAGDNAQELNVQSRHPLADKASTNSGHTVQVAQPAPPTQDNAMGLDANTSQSINNGPNTQADDEKSLTSESPMP